jgi:hypothetical protein
LGILRATMKKMLRSMVLATAVGAIGLGGCDQGPPPAASVPPADGPAADATASDVVREKLAEILRDPDAYARLRKLATLLPTLGPETAAAAQQTLEDQTLDVTGAETELLIRYWATHRPEEAALWARAKVNPSYRPGAVHTALRVWAQADPLAATGFAWTWGDEDPTISIDVHRALVRGWFDSKESPRLVDWMRSLEMGIPRQRAVATYARALIQTQGTEAPLRWADSLSDQDPSFKLEAYRQSISMLTRFDIPVTVRWCDAHCDEAYAKNVRTIVGTRWGMRDAAAALAWLSTQTPGYETRVAVRATYGEWVRRERGPSIAWMAERTPAGPTGEIEPWLEPIVPVYALALGETDPPEALRWAERMKSADDRQWVQIQIARLWRRKDQAAADAWLDQSPLSEEAREKARAVDTRKVKIVEGPPPGH